MDLIDQIVFTKNIPFNIKMYDKQDWNTNHVTWNWSNAETLVGEYKKARYNQF